MIDGDARNCLEIVRDFGDDGRDNVSAVSNMRYSPLLLFIPLFILGALGVSFTANKLDKMRRIRGWKPGAEVRSQTVHDKWSDHHTGGWVALSERSVRTPGDHRLYLPTEVWNRYDVGDSIDVIYLSGDSSPYHREDIYANDGNFVFDSVLLLFEGGLILISVLGAVVTFLYLRRHRPAFLDL